MVDKHLNEFKTNDLVFLGPEKPLDRAVVWRITGIYRGNAHLESGMTGRRMVAPLERLTRFVPRRIQEPAHGNA